MCWLYDNLTDLEKGFEMGTYSRADLILRIVDGVEKLGLDVEAVTDEILFSMGAAGTATAEGDNPDDFIRFMTRPGVGHNVYGMEAVRLEKEHAVAHFHHCPLVEKWKQLGLAPEKIDKLCVIANKADLGRASNFKHVELTFPKRIGAGDDYCELNAAWKE